MKNIKNANSDYLFKVGRHFFPFFFFFLVCVLCVDWINMVFILKSHAVLSKRHNHEMITSHCKKILPSLFKQYKENIETGLSFLTYSVVPKSLLPQKLLRQ